MKAKLREHLKDCAGAMLRCRKCDATVQKGQEHQHDCVDGLLDKIKILENLVATLVQSQTELKQRQDEIKTREQIIGAFTCTPPTREKILAHIQ